MDKEKTIKNLAKNLELYVKTFVSSNYSRFITEDRKKFLLEIRNFEDFIKIEETGTVSLFVGRHNIYFPLSAYKVINAMKFVPGYGSIKNHKTYQSDTLLTNDNTFSDYLWHVFISGSDTEKYYQENLLHEAMHFCGVGGGISLKEGMAEYITRKFAEEYSFLTSGCGYPKEIKIVMELEKIFGFETIGEMAFCKGRKEIFNLLSNKFGIDAANFYGELEQIAEDEFFNKYYKYDFPGITGPLKKVMKYKDIDYSEVYKKIAEYKSNQNTYAEVISDGK